MRLKFILGMLGLGVLGLLALSLSSPKGGITSTGQPGATAPGENDHPSELQLQEKTDPTGPAELPN